MTDHPDPQADRRRFLKSAAWATLAAGTVTSARAGDYQVDHPPTPTEIKGPFYPVHAQKDKDFDLTRIKGRDERAKGEAVIIEGRVLDTEGEPVEDAQVEIWQANAAGRYRHPHDANPAPIDPHFQGWAIVPSGEKGGFRFRTIVPGPYPVSEKWERPPHIHYKVSKRGYVELVTQMYFPDEPLNEKDRLLQRKSDAEQSLMIARRTDAEEPTFAWTIYLEEA
ncbi:MAG: protocatechuate 3,4-dioxygenase [Phycisphaeraceae bacterium]|nr:protocatechuate 3,4-dioxygenase [Phycisphaeraceae bacterium]